MALSTSSLLNSAASRRAKIRATEDAYIAFEWERSSQTYSDYKQYSQFLKTRAKNSTDPSNALSYQRKIQTANRSYTSNEIQRQTQAVMTGSSSVPNKKAVVQALYQRATDTGDMNLAQNLISTWNGLDIQEQNMAASAAAAAERLANANEKHAKNVGRAYEDIGDELEEGLELLTKAFNKGGQLEYNKAAKKFVKENKATLKALGIDLPKNYSTSVGQLIEGTIQGIATYYDAAAQATALDAPDASEMYEKQLDAIVRDNKTFKTPAGDINYSEVKAFVENPNLFVESTNEKGETQLVRSSLKGFVRDKTGKVTGLPTGQSRSDKDASVEKDLRAMGFDVVEFNSKTGGYKVQLTGESKDGSPTTESWLNSEIIGKTKNAEFEVYKNDNGSLQFRNDDRLFNIGRDSNNLAGLFEVDRMGITRHVQGQYGFNQEDNAVTNNKQAINWSKVRQAESLSGNRGIPKETTGSSGKPSMGQRNDGGFNYKDGRGRPISAYTYSKLTNTSFRSVLSGAASKGDKYSASALKYAGNDGAYNPAKVDIGTAKNWSSLTWGNDVKLQTPQALRLQKAYANSPSQRMINPQSRFRP